MSLGKASSTRRSGRELDMLFLSASEEKSVIRRETEPVRECLACTERRCPRTTANIASDAAATANAIMVNVNGLLAGTLLTYDLDPSAPSVE